jgi:uncharacterized protein YecT (DUF1311 family)
MLLSMGKHSLKQIRQGSTLPGFSQAWTSLRDQNPAHRLSGKDCRGIALALAILTISTARLFAQLGLDPEMKSACGKYAETPLPAEALAVASPKRWPFCNSYKFYGGAQSPVDYEAARNCAWSERLASQAGLEPVYLFGRAFGGSAMLTLLYSNGQGVEKNIPLAIRFACESGWAPGLVDGYVEQLEVAKGRHPSSDSTFRFCDGFPGSFMEDYCEHYDAQQADQTRSSTLKDLSSPWPEPQRRALAALEEAQLGYSEAHAKGEPDTAGASRTTQQIRAQQSLRNSFLAAVRAFEASSPPTAPATSAAQADAELDRVYTKAVGDAESARSNPDAVLAEDLHTAQDAWLTYRDAWLAFAKLRYPTLDAGSLLALLTRDRVATLRGEPCEYDPDTSDCSEQDTQPPRPLP